MIENELRKLFEEIATIRRKKYFEQLRKLGLHIGQDQLLCQLSKEDGLTQKQLSEKLSCEPPTVANALKSLENHAFVAREQDQNDGRTKRVFLTEKGRSIVQPVHEVWMREQRHLLSGMSDDELVVLKTLLTKIVNNAQQIEHETKKEFSS